MPSLVASLAVGTVFGLALAAPPGPMNAVIAQESVVRGWRAGASAGMGAFTADATFFVLAAVGVVEFVETAPTLKAAMVAAGGVLMLYFAYGAFAEARAGTAFGVERTTDSETPASDGDEPIDDSVPDVGDDQRGFTKAFALAITNPYQIVFWLTVGVRMLRPGTIDVLSHAPYVGGALDGVLVVTTGSPALLVGFFLGILLWVAGFPATLVAAGKRVDDFAPAVAGTSAVVLAGFGVVFVADAVGAFL
ncbi:LysE family transporter [Halorubellus sp. JP-L1]|uniref:LysE family translocator n=1 Tax=Halorubellus sp. JP-L1 TaxID=2715753 RepID=UPI0014092149|nr:LysE family transporter [Halorubellus sp. JP-L1]NHN42558.1 LysE family transporter [Halorubellus sp. JP-L1]